MSQFRPPFQLPDQPPQYSQPPYMQPGTYQQPPLSYGVPKMPSPPKPKPSNNSPARKSPQHPRKPWQLILFGLIVGLVIGYAAHTQPSQPTTNVTRQPSSQAITQPTATPTLALQPTATSTQVPQPTVKPMPTPTANPHGDVGVTNNVGIWNVTLNKVYTATSGVYSQPKAGDIYVVVDITSENTDSSGHLLSSGAMFVFQDQSGQSYDEQITGIGKPPDETVPPSSKLRGQIVYEVSNSLHSFTLLFQDSVYNGNTATWNINV